MSQVQAPLWARTISVLTDKLSMDFMAGVVPFKLAYAINFHKVITLFLILGLMFYTDNFTTAAWCYLALHGTYGYCWLVKDFGFRDGSFERDISLPGAIMLYLLLVGWYWLLPWLFITGQVEPTGFVWFVAIALHTLGITWMIAADCQKHFSLKYNRGLITEGVFAYTRNPNFLGEILIYASYALLVNHWIGWLVFAWGCTFFLSRMKMKDASISRYPEWPEYAARSSLLIPWGLFRHLVPTKKDQLKEDHYARD